MNDDTFHAQALMSAIPGSVTNLLEFLRFGIVTNWWGLGCPSHCGAPSISSLGLAFSSGLGFGLLLGLAGSFILCFKAGLIVLPSSFRPSWSTERRRATSDRLAAYVYE